MKLLQCVSVMAALVLMVGTVTQADVIKHRTTTIDMEFVTVGNAGNAADINGLGSVGYNYRIGTYEVTAEQWEAVRQDDTSVLTKGAWSDSQPTASTSWFEAAKFCNWLTTGNTNSGVYNTKTWASMDRQTAVSTFGVVYFIPTENEWFKAAYYDPNKGGAGVGGYWDYTTKHDFSTLPDGIDAVGDTQFDAVFRQSDVSVISQPNSVDNTGVVSLRHDPVRKGGEIVLGRVGPVTSNCCSPLLGSVVRRLEPFILGRDEIDNTEGRHSHVWRSMLAHVLVLYTPLLVFAGPSASCRTSLLRTSLWRPSAGIRSWTPLVVSS